MAEQKIFQAPGVNVGELAGMVSDWFRGEGFEVQTLEAPGGGMIVQARKSDGWRTVTGTSAALNVTMTPQGDNLIVETGAAKWVDKAAVGVATLILFWPALIAPAYGAWKQSQLPNQVFQVIERYIITGQVPVVATAPVRAPVAAPPPSGLNCPSCGQAVRAEAKFCDHCGATLQLACPQCGEALRPGAKFCDSCGAKVEPAA
jgi:hypothetical protein